MTNAEVYGALALILMELQKINEHLEATVKRCGQPEAKETNNDTI